MFVLFKGLPDLLQKTQKQPNFIGFKAIPLKYHFLSLLPQTPYILTKLEINSGSFLVILIFPPIS